MRTQPVEPARITVGGDGEPPFAPAFGDLYHPRIGALAQAHHVFLHGTGLPGRWAGHGDFTVLETGFGLGHNFLATWQAWRDDPARPARLHYVAVDRHPPTREDLAAVHASHAGAPASLAGPADLARALIAAWPPLTPNLHPLAFDGGRVRLLLGWGDAQALLRELVLRADAVFLDGFAPDRNPAMWTRPLLEAVARRCRVGARAATWSVARPVREALAAAGFVVETAPGIGGKREVLQATYAPRFVPPPPAGEPVPPASRDVLVVGAGLAGSAVAHSLAALGWHCTVVDRHPAPAGEASGQPAGLFHGVVHADDGAHARWHRAAALHAARTLPAAFAAGVGGEVAGLLRLAADGTPLSALEALAARQRLPADYVRPLAAADASSLAGVPVTRPAWWYPGGGWAVPGALVRHRLAMPGVEFRGGVEVAALRADGDRWALLDRAGRRVAAAATVVLANAAGAAALLAGHAAALPPLHRRRGQVSWWHETPAGWPRPRCPLAGGGYAVALPGGGLLSGATDAADAGDDDTPRAADDVFNLGRLARLLALGDGAAAQAPAPQARVGWRVVTADRLPVVGPVPAADAAAPARIDRPRLVPRQPGLWIASALGGRGLAGSGLLGEVLAARIAGLPVPLEADLLDALDPARALVRAARRG